MKFTRVTNVPRYDRHVKYVPSALIGQLSKSSGSTTASRNRNGSYLRTRNNPTNPRTAKQTAARADFQGLAQNWRMLTDAQRAGWTALGTSMIRTDSLGQSYNMTGLQAYESVNRTLTVIGAAQVNTAPVYTAPAALLSATFTATSV